MPTIFVTPRYSPSLVDEAGRVVASDDLTDLFLFPVKHGCDVDTVVSNWRASHQYPLNTFQTTLRQRAQRVLTKGVLVAQRIKRLSSIEQKLRRFPDLTLSEIQDIAGCRDLFQSEGLKSSSGSPEWTRFFALMGSAIAAREGCRRGIHRGLR